MAINVIITVITQCGWIHPRKAAQEQNRLYYNTFLFAFVLMNIHATNVLVVILGNKNQIHDFGSH